MKNQLLLLQKQKSDHGGNLKSPQKRARPLSVSQSMHLVLRSSQARGGYSFRRHRKDIELILKRFAIKYHIEIKSYANVGNHLHLHIKLFKRHSYTPFIRGITAAIMMRVTGFSRWRPKPEGFQFWDQRPFSRIIESFKAFKNLVDYVQINHLEGLGVWRAEAVSEVRSIRLQFETS